MRSQMATERVDHAVTVDGVSLLFESRGAGLPVYVCHGGPSTTYGYLADDLQPLESSMQLVFHDYRGSGGSAAAPRDSYTFSQLANDLDQIRAHLGHDKISLLAHSMGGFVALSYAIRFPGRCTRLCLLDVSPTGKASTMMWPTLRAAGSLRIARMIARGLWYGMAWSWRRETKAKKQARYAPMAVLQEGRAEFRSEIRARGERFLVQNDNASALERLGFSTDLTSELGGLTMPVRVIVGSRDAAFVAGAELLRRGMPHVDVSVLNGVGHEPLVEARDETLSMIRDFLTAV